MSGMGEHKLTLSVGGYEFPMTVDEAMPPGDLRLEMPCGCVSQYSAERDGVASQRCGDHSDPET